jgi:tyrosyl-tRNA synthetase
MASATVEERFELITRRLQEVLGGDSIRAVLNDGRTPKCYWGTLSAIVNISGTEPQKTLQALRQLVDVSSRSLRSAW